MAKNKTMYTDVDVTEFINKVDNEVKRYDSFKLIEIFKSVSGFEPRMWGPTIIGFGDYHYKYASGHEGSAPLAAFSPRTTSIVFYLCCEDEDKSELFAKLGKFKSSKACVYIKKLDDIDIAILKKLIKSSIESTLQLYPPKS